MNFRELLKSNAFIYLDGGMGTMLHLQPGELPERLNLTEPERVAAVHRAYAEAGSQIVYANTFGANPLKLDGTGIDTAETVRAAVRLAKELDGVLFMKAGQLLKYISEVDPGDRNDRKQ